MFRDRILVQNIWHLGAFPTTHKHAMQSFVCVYQAPFLHINKFCSYFVSHMRPTWPVQLSNQWLIINYGFAVFQENRYVCYKKLIMEPQKGSRSWSPMWGNLRCSLSWEGTSLASHQPIIGRDNLENCHSNLPLYPWVSFLIMQTIRES